MPKVFVSATTRDLKSYRTVVAEWARANGYEPIVQDEFPVQSDFGTIVQMLREKLDPCDAVIHLAGLFYGFEPTNRPDGESRRSYTQLEYELGKEHKRQVFRFIARTDYEPDNTFTQTDEQTVLQEQHRHRLMQGNEAWSSTSRTTGNELYYEFSNHDELRVLLDNIIVKPTLAKPQNLPLVGSLFKGRDKFIEQLRSVLVNKPTFIAAVTAKQTIYGLGGVGKTRVAVEYAKRFSHEYTALLFITADSPSSLQRNLANLCGALVLNLPEKDAREQEVQVAAALRWLREHSGWFLIVDNVDTPEAATAVENLLQELDTGHVVVTSRLSQWGDAVEELSLDVISESDAAELLLERTRGKRKPATTDDVDALTLAKDLGRLPLALEQAGAFIAKHRGSFQEYRTRWKSQESKVLTWHDQRSMKYPASVATTWQTSFDLLSEDARRLLNFLCWLAPDPIPLTMVNKLSAFDSDKAVDVETGVADLAEYSLLKWSNTTQDFVEVHQLVQEISRFRLSELEKRHYLSGSLAMLDLFVDQDPSDEFSWQAVYVLARSHARVAIDHAFEVAVLPKPSRLMNRIGIYLYERGDFADAEVLLRLALDVQAAIAPPNSPAIAIIMGNLAAALLAAGRLTEAEHLSRESRRIIVECVDESSWQEKSQLVFALNNLGQSLTSCRKFDEAEPLFRMALQICEEAKNHQSRHSKHAVVLNNLGLLLKETIRLDEAEVLLRDSISLMEQSLGDTHPRLALPLHNLAAVLNAKKNCVEAELAVRRAIAIKERHHDPNSYQLATSLAILAEIQKESNRPKEAASTFSRCLLINAKCFGENSIQAATEMSNLATVLYQMDNAAKAEILVRTATSIFLQSKIETHLQDAVLNLIFLSKILLDTNRAGDAEQTLWTAMGGAVQLYGLKHDITQVVLTMLASVLQSYSGLSETDALAKIQRKLRGEK